MLVAGFMWMYAVWGANNSRFIVDNFDLTLMILAGPLGMIAGILVIMEDTD